MSNPREDDILKRLCIRREIIGDRETIDYADFAELVIQDWDVAEQVAKDLLEQPEAILVLADPQDPQLVERYTLINREALEAQLEAAENDELPHKEEYDEDLIVDAASFEVIDGDGRTSDAYTEDIETIDRLPEVMHSIVERVQGEYVERGEKVIGFSVELRTRTDREAVEAVERKRERETGP